MDFLGTVLRGVGSGVGSMLKGAASSLAGAASPLLGGVFGNIISGINQRAARKWEEEMYNQYNSPSALVRQYDEAGINPALMFGGQTPAAPTDTSAAPVTDFQTGSVTDMIGQLMQLDMLDAEKRIKKASASKLEEETVGQRLNNEINRQFGILEKQYSISEIIARINKYEEETATTMYERDFIGPLREKLLKAQSRGENASSAINEWKAEYMKKYDADPDSDPIKQALTSFLEWLNNRPDKKHGNNLPGGKDSPVTIPDYGVK